MLHIVYNLTIEIHLSKYVNLGLVAFLIIYRIMWIGYIETFPLSIFSQIPPPPLLVFVTHISTDSLGSCNRLISLFLIRLIQKKSLQVYKYDFKLWINAAIVFPLLWVEVSFIMVATFRSVIYSISSTFITGALMLMILTHVYLLVVCRWAVGLLDDNIKIFLK